MASRQRASCVILIVPLRVSSQTDSPGLRVMTSSVRSSELSDILAYCGGFSPAYPLSLVNSPQHRVAPDRVQATSASASPPSILEINNETQHESITRIRSLSPTKDRLIYREV